MDGTCAALGDPTAEFSSGQSGLLANDPQQRCRWIDVQFMSLTVDFQCDHIVHRSSLPGRIIVSLMHLTGQRREYGSRRDLRPGKFALLLAG